ncbi:hypothetical protein JW859_09950 [bacterium]|nr:hypothetical protein [bacterium]
MDMLLFFFWLMGLIVNIGCAAALYILAERRFSNGAMWAFIGLITGLLGVIVYFGYVFFDASMNYARGTVEEQRVREFMEEQLRSVEDQAKNMPAAESRDSYLTELIAHGKYEEAQAHAREKLRMAHEYGDGPGELFYRNSLEFIEQKLAIDEWSDRRG